MIFQFASIGVRECKLFESTRAHQKLQRRKDAGVFLLSEAFQSISKGGFEQLRPGALRPAGQKQPARLFLAARLA